MDSSTQLLKPFNPNDKRKLNFLSQRQSLEYFDDDFRVFYANSSPKRPYEVPRGQRKQQEILIVKSMQDNPFKRLEKLKKAQRVFKQKNQIQSLNTSLRFDSIDENRQQIAQNKINLKKSIKQLNKSDRLNSNEQSVLLDSQNENSVQTKQNLWYPSVSDFMSHINSDFDQIYSNKLQSRQDIQCPPKQNPSVRKKFLQFTSSQKEISDSPKETIINYGKNSSFKKDYKRVTFISQPSQISIQDQNLISPIQIDVTEDPLLQREGGMLFKFGDQKNYWFDVKDLKQHQMYEANLVKVSKRSKFKIYANVDKQNASQRELFVERCGLSSQNKYRNDEDSFDLSPRQFEKKSDQMKVRTILLSKSGQQKDGPIDQQLMDFISKQKKNSVSMIKDKYSEPLSDKLFKFQEIENFSKDYSLPNKIEELAQRRKKVLAAMEQFEKNNKFK
eukprot:403362952